MATKTKPLQYSFYFFSLISKRRTFIANYMYYFGKQLFKNIEQNRNWRGKRKWLKRKVQTTKRKCYTPTESLFDDNLLIWSILWWKSVFAHFQFSNRFLVKALQSNFKLCWLNWSGCQLTVREYKRKRADVTVSPTLAWLDLAFANALTSLCDTPFSISKFIFSI